MAHTLNLSVLMGGEALKTVLLRKVISLALLVVAIGGPSLRCEMPSAHLESRDQKKYQEVIRFMDLLKAHRPVTRKFNVKDVPNWEIKSIAGFIYAGGVTVEDVNTKVVKRYSPYEVELALTQKRGEIFTVFSHISFLYAKGKKQYSELKFTDKPDGILAVLASWYELEFVSDGTHFKLRKCKYVNTEND